MSYAVIKDWSDPGFDGFGAIKLPSSAKLAPPSSGGGEIGTHEEQRRLSSGRIVTVKGPAAKLRRPGDYAPAKQPPPADTFGAGGMSCSPPYVLSNGKCVNLSTGGGFFPGPTGGGAPPPLPAPPEPIVPGAPPPFVPGSGGFSCKPPMVYYQGGCILPGSGAQASADPVCNPPFVLQNGKCIKTSSGGSLETGPAPSPESGGIMQNYLPPPPTPVFDAGSKSGGGTFPSGGGSGTSSGGSASTFSSSGSGGASSGSGAGAGSKSLFSSVDRKVREMLFSNSSRPTPLSPDPGYGPWQTQHAYQAAQSAFAAQHAAAMQPGSNVTVVSHIAPPMAPMTEAAAPAASLPTYTATGPVTLPGSSVVRAAAFEDETKAFPWGWVAAAVVVGGGAYYYSQKGKRGRR